MVSMVTCSPVGGPGVLDTGWDEADSPAGVGSHLSGTHF